MKCKECGKEYEESSQAFAGFCSYKCYEKWARFHKTPNCTCPVCGKGFYMKPYRIKRVKHQICCSLECASKLRSEWFSGENNHQYGLVGKLNSSFKYEEILTHYGYISVSVPDHPFCTKSRHVFKHRLVVEENAKLFDKKYFIYINGKPYLKKEYVVHHKNGIRTDNRIENLEIMTLGEHSSMHNSETIWERDKLGRFKKIIGVSKSGNIGESCDANPEIRTKMTKGLVTSYSVVDEQI